MGVLPSGVEVVLGQVNRVPEPPVPDMVVYWPLRRIRLALNTNVVDTVNNIVSSTQPTQADIQLDVHGPASADNAQIISTLFRDAIAADMLAPNVAPLFCADPKQVPFTNSEDQYEERWVVELSLQVNPVVSGMPQQSANTVEVDLINVEATYPL